MPQMERRGFIGGSDIAAIMGVSPWATPYSLYCEKTAREPEPITPEKEKFFNRRKKLEPLIIDLARDEYGLDITSRNQVYTDKTLPWARAEIDFEWQDDDGSIQNADAKSASPFTRDKWGIEQGDDDIPMQYTAQFLWGQMCSGRDLTLCATLIGTDDLRIYRVKRDEQLIHRMREMAIEFWDRVQTRRPPPITAVADVRKAFPSDQGGTICADPEIYEALQDLVQVKEDIKFKEETKEALEARIQAYMGANAFLVDDQSIQLASWKTQNRGGYTVAPTSFRVFRPSKPKK